ncbi:MAG TPA: hypothetical protein VIA18_19720, partial [Polyangia bacterium]|nr:hypothetical protein [Polyangia bacterium]
MKRLGLSLLSCALLGGCADRPLSILPGAPRDLSAPADLAHPSADQGDAGAPVDQAAPADLGPIGAPAPSWSGDAVAYQVDPMHRGAQTSALV